MTNLFNRVETELENKISLRDKDNFLLSKLPLPSTIPNMSKAAKLVLEAFERGDKILIVGDYDLDGISATALMCLAFIDAGLIRGVHFDWIVPDRFVDGYGISRNMVDFAIKGGFKTIITVDNGIGGYDAVEYANENGITVVITDHHTPGEKIPNAEIIVDLKLNKGKFPLVDISGCTIAWFFQAQFKKEAGKRSAARKKAFPLKEINMKDYTDLVGLTVISDVMPLVGMNVGFYYHAVAAIKSGRRLAYNLFFHENKKLDLTETDLSFGMIPAMNASGRIDHAKHAVELLMTRDFSVAKEKYDLLLEINARRKKLTQDQVDEIMPEATEQAKAGKRAIVIARKGLHEGIVGILAGRISEKFELPAFIFGYSEEKNIFKGSGRTSGEVNLYNLIDTAGEHSVGYGGHPGAIGAGIAEVSFQKWTDKVQDEATKIDEALFEEINPFTFEAELEDLNVELTDLINAHRPFGQGFPEPIFTSKGKINILRELGRTGQHWQASVTDENGISKKMEFFFDENIPNIDGTIQNIEFKIYKNTVGYKPTVNIKATIVYPKK